jgi:hypothetical protein
MAGPKAFKSEEGGIQSSESTIFTPQEGGTPVIDDAANQPESTITMFGGPGDAIGNTRGGIR